jgi:small subunit ribosomal protein S16
MAAKLRLARAGKKKSSYYRVIATDSHSRRDGRFIEQVGTYDPRTNPPTVKFDEDKLAHWLKVGAEQSQTVAELIRRAHKGGTPGATATPAAAG